MFKKTAEKENQPVSRLVEKMLYDYTARLTSQDIDQKIDTLIKKMEEFSNHMKAIIILASNDAGKIHTLIKMTFCPGSLKL